MLTVFLAAVLSTGTGVSAKQGDYTLAYQQSLEQKKPLMVVVGADWCPACEALKNSTIREMEQNGELSEVSVAIVDRDAEPELAQRLMKGENRIPQIIVFSKDDQGRWQSRKLTGFQSAQPVRSLIRRAVSLTRS